MTKALVTLSLLKTQWDDQQDYLDNFRPFVAEHLVDWPPTDAVDAGAVAQRLRDGVGIDLPAGVVEMLLSRLRRAGYVARSHGSYYVVPEKLAELPDLAADRERSRNEMDNLAERVLAHARAAHGLDDWNEQRAMDAVERFVDSLGPQFMKDRRRGTVQEPGRYRNDVAVVQSYARAASTSDEHGLQLLENAVAGAMLSAVLHYSRHEDRSQKLDGLVAYLDTAVVLHMLGVCVPQLEAAAHELHELLRHHGIELRIFRHTFDETLGVLNSTAANLRKSRSAATHATARLSRTSREVLDYFLSQGWQASDVEEVIAHIDERLENLRIEVVDTPEHTRKMTLDETKLGQVLQKGIGYQNENARNKDVDSLAAVHRVREGRNGSSLADCTAVFVTTNTGLVRCSRAFFKGEGLNGGVPHAMADLELTTQLWIRKPGQHPELPRKLIIADSFAALDPGPRFWDRCLKMMDRMKDERQVTEQEVTALVFSTTARSALLDQTLSDPERLEEETIRDVLETYQEELARPLVQQAEAKAAAQAAADADRISAAEGRVDELSGTVEALAVDKDELSRTVADLKRQADEGTGRKQRNRRVVAGVMAAAEAAGIVVVIAGTELSQLITTVVATVLAVAVSGTLAWGWRQPSLSWKAWVAVGVILAPSAAFWAFAERRDDASKPAKNGTKPAGAVTTSIP